VSVLNLMDNGETFLPTSENLRINVHLKIMVPILYQIFNFPSIQLLQPKVLVDSLIKYRCFEK
jgi:hypothetical protein